MAQQTPVPTPPRFSGFRREVSLTILACVLLLNPTVPSVGRLLGAALLALVWLAAGARWSVRRYGRPAARILVGLVVAVVGVIGLKYWLDRPNQRAAAEVKALGAYYVGTAGVLFTGEVEYVFFDEAVGDEQVARFTRMGGLNGLRRLVLKQTRITDATAQRLGGLTGLRHLYLEGTGVSPTTIDQLRRKLPGCAIEVR